MPAVVGALMAGAAVVPVNRSRASASSSTCSPTRIRRGCSRLRGPVAGGAGGPAAHRGRPRRARRRVPRRARRRERRRSSSTPRAPPARPRARCSRAGRSPRTSTRWPTPGTGPARTCSPTGCALFHVHFSASSSSACSGPPGSAARHHLRSLLLRGGCRGALGMGPRRCSSASHDVSPPAADAEGDLSFACARSARLLVSGSSALPAVDHERIERLHRTARGRALRMTRRR